MLEGTWGVAASLPADDVISVDGVFAALEHDALEAVGEEREPLARLITFASGQAFFSRAHIGLRDRSPITQLRNPALNLSKALAAALPTGALAFLLKF